MSCDYCSKQKDIEHDYLTVRIRGDKLKISYSAYSCDSDFSTELTINFCPMCASEIVKQCEGV